MRFKGPFKRYSIRRRVIALASGLLMVAACLAIPVAALASGADSCHGTPLSYGRCDGTSPSFGQTILALPVNPVQIPGLPPAGSIAGHSSAAAPDDSFHGSLTARAPPLF